MAKLYKTDKEARDALLKGVQVLGKLVTITMGPKGRNVALDRQWSSPAVIHDGVSVAREIFLQDPFENMGAQLVQEAAGKTADRAGDGTTTSTLLAWKLIEKGFKKVDDGHNPVMLQEGMNKAAKEIVRVLLEAARPVQKDDIPHVATISAANEEIGKTIAEAMEKVGPDGVITVEEGMGQETTIEHKEGMMFDKGYASGSPYFVTNKKDMTVEIENPMILYTDMVIDSIQDFTEFVDKMVTEQDRNIVIIADHIEIPCMQFLVDNHTRGIIRAYAVQAPSFGVKRVWMLEDMAALTGGIVVTRQSGRTLASLNKEELGRAEKIWADADNTKIIGGRGRKEKIADRIAALRQQIDKEESEFEKKSLRERIAKLAGGAAVIKVGALTETELKDRKERVIDAVEATKSAVAEGIIAGGGIALLQIQESLNSLIEQEEDPEVKEGIKLVQSVLNEPFKKIVQNAGEVAEILLEKIHAANMVSGNPTDWRDFGYNVVTKKFGNMFEMGVIDPVKVTRQAIENATSVAGMVLITEGLVTDIPEDRKMPQEKTPPML